MQVISEIFKACNNSKMPYTVQTKKALFKTKTK